MIYMSTNFPKEYDDRKIYLNEILSEKDGVKFLLIITPNILNTQVESIKTRHNKLLKQD
jgi:hypothetical protein